MRKLFKVITILAAVAAISAVCGLMACNSDDEGELEFTLSDDETYYSVTGYSGGGSSVEIPSTYNDLPVTEISNSAFRDTNIKSITIPDSITYIGNNAFYRCKNLSGDIVLSDNVTYLGYQAFFACDSINSVVIGSSITEIQTQTFSDCDNLKEITLGSSITTIENSAFYKTAITSVTIPSSITSIGNFVFHSCTSLTSVTIGSGMTTIGYGAFEDCTALANVTFTNTNGWYVTETENAASGDNVTLTDTEANATLLTNTYLSCYWYRTN